MMLDASKRRLTILLLFVFYRNIFYKIIEAEVAKILTVL